MKSHKSLSGFTLLEMVVVVFIVSVAIVGVYSALFIMVILNAGSTDMFQASYLSQEGTEIVRNIRDTNWLQSLDEEGDIDEWVQNIMDVCQAGGGGCQLDYTTTGATLAPFNESNPAKLYLDADGFYSYDQSGTITKFSRRITTTLLEQYAMLVTVETFWDEKPNILNPLGSTQKAEVEEILYNWY